MYNLTPSALLILPHYSDLSSLVSNILWTYAFAFVVCCLPFLSTEPELDVAKLFAITVVPLPSDVELSPFSLSVFLSLTHHTPRATYFAILPLYSELFGSPLMFFSLSFTHSCTSKNQRIHRLFFLPSTSLLCCDSRWRWCEASVSPLKEPLECSFSQLLKPAWWDNEKQLVMMWSRIFSAGSWNIENSRKQDSSYFA